MGKIAPETTYVVSAGEYSDYQVLCVCPTRGDAEAIAAKVRKDPGSWHRNARVEEMVVLDDDSARKHKSLTLVTVIWDDGTEDRKEPSITEKWPFGHGFEPLVAWRWVRAPTHERQGGGGRLRVWGCDHERVRKVFSDKRAQLLANRALRERKEMKGRKGR